MPPNENTKDGKKWFQQDSISHTASDWIWWVFSFLFIPSVAEQVFSFASHVRRCRVNCACESFHRLPCRRQSSVSFGGIKCEPIRSIEGKLLTNSMHLIVSFRSSVIISSFLTRHPVHQFVSSENSSSAAFGLSTRRLAISHKEPTIIFSRMFRAHECGRNGQFTEIERRWK